MADTDDYELLSHNEIQTLRDELKRLKENPASSDKSLQVAMGNLTKVIGELMTLIKDAEHSMQLDTDQDKEMHEQLKTIDSRLKNLEDQNEKIASAMVAIADMVEKNTKETKEHHAPSPKPHGDPFSAPPSSPAPGSPFDPGTPKPPMPGSTPSLDDPFGAPPSFEGMDEMNPMNAPPQQPGRPPMGMPPPGPGAAPPPGPKPAAPPAPSQPPKPPKKKFSLFGKK